MTVCVGSESRWKVEKYENVSNRAKGVLLLGSWKVRGKWAEMESGKRINVSAVETEGYLA